MAIITYPLNNIEYTAEDAELYHATRTSGVFANDDFPITVSGDGNVVTIGEGIGWIRNSKFSGKVVANKSEMSLDLGLPHATYPRIDAVVLQFNANANASEIIVKNGTAKTNPMPPEVVRTESVYELHLYHVYREAGAASVTASNVTDLRSDSAYCGIMSDDVTMLGDDYVSKNMVGVANGVASLGANGKVPESQLPSMDYIPTSQKGAAGGVASLGSDGKLPVDELPTTGAIDPLNLVSVSTGAVYSPGITRCIRYGIIHVIDVEDFILSFEENTTVSYVVAEFSGASGALVVDKGYVNGLISYKKSDASYYTGQSMGFCTYSLTTNGTLNITLNLANNLTVGSGDRLKISFYSMSCIRI